MDIFVARQPIFTRKRQVAAYELLFRQGLENAFPPGTDTNKASAKVIAEALAGFGFDVLVGGKKAFINATRPVLVDKLYEALPAKYTVIELLETVKPDEEVVKACREATQAGYTLALDDFVRQPGIEPLVKLAKVIKIDVLATKGQARKDLMKQLQGWSGELLAEKVETKEEFEEMLKEGFAYFQGYFFARPEIVARKDIPAGKLIYLQLLGELVNPNFDAKRIEDVMKLDVALSTRLLRFLNSTHFSFSSKVTSLRQAIVLLGERPFRQWAALLPAMAVAATEGGESPVTCLVRARFCELLAEPAGMKGASHDAFFVGLLSSLDLLLGLPMEELIKEFPLSAETKAALLAQGAESSAPILKLVRAFEGAKWAELTQQIQALSLQDVVAVQAYRDAVSWAQKSLAGNH